MRFFRNAFFWFGDKYPHNVHYRLLKVFSLFPFPYFSHYIILYRFIPLGAFYGNSQNSLICDFLKIPVNFHICACAYTYARMYYLTDCGSMSIPLYPKFPKFRWKIKKDPSQVFTLFPYALSIFPF